MMMLNRFSRVGLKFNNLNKLNNNNLNKNVFNQIINKRNFSTENQGENEGDDITKLFKITQEITQELGHTDEIAPLSEDGADDVDSLKEDYEFPLGVINVHEKYPLAKYEEEFPFPILPNDSPLLPVTEEVQSIEDLIIEYKDPFAIVKPNSYAPFFRFTEPRGFTVESFLKTIGRECDSHVELFPTWEDLMSTTSRKLKEQQVPVRNRKWILHWVEQFKQGRDPVFISKAKSIAKVNKKK